METQGPLARAIKASQSATEQNPLSILSLPGLWTVRYAGAGGWEVETTTAVLQAKWDAPESTCCPCALVIEKVSVCLCVLDPSHYIHLQIPREWEGCSYSKWRGKQKSYGWRERSGKSLEVAHYRIGSNKGRLGERNTEDITISLPSKASTDSSSFLLSSNSPFYFIPCLSPQPAPQKTQSLPPKSFAPPKTGTE